jgi:hypothetical protein
MSKELGRRDGRVCQEYVAIQVWTGRPDDPKAKVKKLVF